MAAAADARDRVGTALELPRSELLADRRSAVIGENVHDADEDRDEWISEQYVGPASAARHSDAAATAALGHLAVERAQAHRFRMRRSFAMWRFAAALPFTILLPLRRARFDVDRRARFELDRRADFRLRVRVPPRFAVPKAFENTN